MGRLLSIVLLTALVLLGANFKLYLKDGSYHLVREYKVDGDRARYFSVERGDWEEIPVELLDLKRTDAENSERQAKLNEETKMVDAEEKARKDQDREVSRIPQDPGVYMLDDNKKLRIFPLAEQKVHTSKSRNVWKVLSPVPLIAGKATVELDAPQSRNVVTDGRPEFFVQLSVDEQFGIVKVASKGAVRIVDRLTIVPVSKEVVDEVDEVAIFRKQLTESWLYKIWPEQPLADGEYAVVQFTPGKMNMQIWDFSVKAAK